MKAYDIGFRLDAKKFGKKIDNSKFYYHNTGCLKKKYPHFKKIITAKVMNEMTPFSH